MCLLGMLATSAYAEGVPEDCTQLIVAVAPAWDSARGRLRKVQHWAGMVVSNDVSMWQRLREQRCGEASAWGSVLIHKHRTGIVPV
jgi:hypothetical protein